eukprot:489377_1
MSDLSMLDTHQNNLTHLTPITSSNDSNPCTNQQSNPSYKIYQNNTYAVLYDKNQLVWAYMNNEYHRCKIIEILHPKQSSTTTNNNTNNNDTDDDIDENDATPPLTTTNNIDTLSDCSTPPISTQFNDDCSTPEPILSDTDTVTVTSIDNIHNGLCSSSMPIYNVLCLTPRYKHDKPCQHFMDNNKCQYNENNKCLFSHGWKMPQDRIKSMDEKDINYILKVNDRCLSKWYKDNLWYKSRIKGINLMKNKTIYNVLFDNYSDDNIHNVTKDMIVPYTSKLDIFNDLHCNESVEIHNNNNNDFCNKNMIELSSSEFGQWQQHTNGIGLKYLMKFGYEIGDGLGKHKQGRSEPVPIKKIKKNVGLDFINQNVENHNVNNMNKVKKLIKNKNKTFNPNTAFWKFIKQKTSNSYNNCVNMCKEKVDKLKEKQSSLIRNMSFDDISAITLYTTSEFYRPLNSSLRSRKDEWAPFCGPLLSGLNKLPFVWQKLYRGTKSKTVKKRIKESYKVGAIVRWDSFTSTSTDKNVATNGFFCGAGGTVFEIESGFRGRDIELFSAVQSEKEILFSVSSHFVITYIDTSAERCIVKLKELPFPWDSKTILWVDDIPTNNKGIMEEFEANGIMVIPRISTFGAKEFLDFTKNAINLNTFGKFRVITDMYRMEWPKDDTSKEQVKDKYAGVTLISELRNVGYNNKVCIYTGNKEKAVNKCEERNVYDNRVLVTTSPSEVKKYGSFQ